MQFSEAVYCEANTAESISWTRTQAGKNDKKPCPDNRQGNYLF